MNKTIHLTALVSDESSVVEATGPSFHETGEGSVKATGWAKKHPKDEPDAYVGYNVAVARALRSLADEYDAKANQAMDPNQMYVNGNLMFKGLDFTSDDRPLSIPSNYTITLNNMKRSDV